MEKLKFILLSIVVIFFLGLIGYWAVSSIQSGSEGKLSQKISQLQEENNSLKEKTSKLESEISDLQGRLEEKTVKETKPVIVAYKYQSLINDLQKLVDDNVYMKLKSSGTRVGTVQQFLNIYNKTSNRIDNNYGATTKSRVAAFQKAAGLASDGEAGSATFKKMIEWLKKQG